MKKYIKKSPIPVYLATIPWVLWAMLLPMYKLWHFILLALISVAVYALSKKRFKDQEIEVKFSPITVDTKDKEIQALVDEGNKAIVQIRELNEKISNEKISDCMDSIAMCMQKIFDHVAQNPEKLTKIRRFMNYYLPTTFKILNAYENLERQNSGGENISSTMQRIEDMTDKIEQAFNHQLDSLFGTEALDIKADISVLENMMAREGISDFNINDKPI